MLNSINKLAEEFLKITKPVRIISHHDTDGITSAAILATALKRLDKKFSIRIVKGLDKNIIETELKRQNKELLFFSDLGSSNLDNFNNLQEEIFILDHHEINKEKLNKKIKIINPHLFNEEEVCGAGLSYLFAKALSPENKDLAKLAIIGMVGDRHDSNISKINQQIIKDTKDLITKKGLLIYPATRPLKKALEYSTSPYIPGVTGEPLGALDLLREISIAPNKCLNELTEEEMSRLITAIMLRINKPGKEQEILGNLYLLKFFNTKEDTRELSVLINACSRLGYHDTALAFCMENEKAKSRALDIYTEYKQQLISALKTIEKIEKIQGNGFVIMNAKNEIKDTIIGTVTSILSSGINYEEGTILIGMAYSQDKVKVSARIVGKHGRNLKEVLEKTITLFKNNNVEVGGHKKAAGCLIEKEQEQEFIQALKENLEIEIVKI